MKLEFDYNKQFKWYEAEITLDTEWCETEVIVKSYYNVKQKGDTLLKWFIDNREHILSEVCSDDLIQLKNDFWLDINEEELTKKYFMDTISLESIVLEDGSIQLWFRDNDIFLGHTIYAEYTLNYQYIYSNML